MPRKRTEKKLIEPKCICGRNTIKLGKEECCERCLEIVEYCWCRHLSPEDEMMIEYDLDEPEEEEEYYEEENEEY